MSSTTHRSASAAAVASLLLVGIALMAGAATPSIALAVDNVSASNVFTLPVPASQKTFASSFGDVVVWGETSGVRGYDLSEKRSFSIPTPKEWTPPRPRISRDWIVYQAYENVSGDKHIYAYDRATEATLAVTSERGDQGNYEIGGDIVVWVSPDESDDSDIFGRNLSTGETFTVTSARGCQGMPDIEGDWVVYSDFAAAHGADVKAYNVKTKATTTLCGWSGAQYFARIGSTGFVVWQYAGNLYGRYVTGGSTRTIAGGHGSQHSPSIGGNLIVYFDDARPSGYGLVGYDLLSGQHFGITKGTTASEYQIAGITDGTIARLHTPETDARLTAVQLIWPTMLEVISDGGAVDESIDVGDDDLLPEPPVEQAWVARIASAATASSVSTVVVSASSSWSNSVIACSLAGRRSPMLLTTTASVPASVLAKLATLAPQHVVVIGGSTTISATVLRQLRSVVGTEAVTSVPGSDVKVRSLGIARIVAGRAGWNGTVLVASTGSAASGLIAVPASVWKGLPLVLADAKGLSISQIAALKSAGAKRFVVVSASVPASTVGRLRTAVGTSNVKSISGTSVASTSSRFAAWAISSCGMSWDRISVASRSNWSHTLTAALSQGRLGSVLVLSDPKSLSAPVKDVLVAHDREIRRVSFVGKSDVVSTNVRRQVRLAIK